MGLGRYCRRKRRWSRACRRGGAPQGGCGTGPQPGPANQCRSRPDDAESAGPAGGAAPARAEHRPPHCLTRGVHRSARGGAGDARRDGGVPVVAA